MNKATLLFAAFSLILSGCVTEVHVPPSRTKYYYPSGTSHSPAKSNGYFCPPGQAKKGRC
jgi:hypothetical protein